MLEKMEITELDRKKALDWYAEQHNLDKLYPCWVC